MGIAYEFDPYLGLSISRVDPLPHQLEAVYDYLLKVARVRFLLADDAGAGKTIMAGLLIRELELRGLAERILVVCPANLAFQWRRELREKLDVKFLVMRGQDIRDQFGVNQWLERPRVITSLDLAKRQDVLLRHLGQVLMRTQIGEGVWGFGFESESNVVDVYIGRGVAGSIPAGGATKCLHLGMPPASAWPNSCRSGQIADISPTRTASTGAHRRRAFGMAPRVPAGTGGSHSMSDAPSDLAPERTRALP